jgi:flagellar FliL protein
MRRGAGIIIVVGAVILVAGAGVALTVTGFLPKLLGMKPPEGTMAAAVEKEKPKEPLTAERYYDIPPMIISLETQGHGNRILQLGLSLLMENRDDASKMHNYIPILIDAMQVYIRALPISETASVAKLSSHREEMLARINAAIAPIKAEEINIRMLLQQ